MLGKHEQFREDVATGQWATEMAEQPYNEPAAASYMASQPYNNLDLQYLQKTTCLDTCFNDDYYSQANSGKFDLSSQAWPLNKPPAHFLLGQAQLPLFFWGSFHGKLRSRDGLLLLGQLYLTRTVVPTIGSRPTCAVVSAKGKLGS